MIFLPLRKIVGVLGSIWGAGRFLYKNKIGLGLKPKPNSLRSSSLFVFSVLLLPSLPQHYSRFFLSSVKATPFYTIRLVFFFSSSSYSVESNSTQLATAKPYRSCSPPPPPHKFRDSAIPATVSPKHLSHL